MNRESDVERELKQRLKELKGGDMAASADEVQQLLSRLVDYRKRMQENKHKWDQRVGPQLRELHSHRQAVGWALQRLDPEELGTNYSVMNMYETAELIKEVEKRRGKIVMSRMLYGCRLEDSYAQETIGVLKAAIQAAKDEQRRWRCYLENAIEKVKRNQEQDRQSKQV